jgi:hypothetical protein
VPATASTGRRITASVQRCQKPGSPGARRGPPRPRSSRPGSSQRARVTVRRPSRAISAGSSVIAVSTAAPTTSMAPSAIERIAVLSIIHRPASEMITVRPLNSTARPDVASATPRASSCDRPAATSSRWRARTNSE